MSCRVRSPISPASPAPMSTPLVEVARNHSSTAPQNRRETRDNRLGRMLPTRPKVARDTTIVGCPLRLPASVDRPSGKNERAMPARVATMDWRRLIPSPKIAAPRPMLSSEALAANHSQNIRAARPDAILDRGGLEAGGLEREDARFDQLVTGKDVLVLRHPHRRDRSGRRLDRHRDDRDARRVDADRSEVLHHPVGLVDRVVLAVHLVGLVDDRDRTGLRQLPAGDRRKRLDEQLLDWGVDMRFRRRRLLVAVQERGKRIGGVWRLEVRPAPHRQGRRAGGRQQRDRRAVVSPHRMSRTAAARPAAGG